MVKGHFYTSIYIFFYAFGLHAVIRHLSTVVVVDPILNEPVRYLLALLMLLISHPATAVK